MTKKLAWKYAEKCNYYKQFDPLQYQPQVQSGSRPGFRCFLIFCFQGVDKDTFTQFTLLPFALISVT